MKHFSPACDLRSELLQVQMPGRYVGGEFGIVKKSNCELTFALAFPDLYEIGMSNIAIRKMYVDINQISGVRCERVFCPAPDFERILRENLIKLYTLESGIPLCNVDIIGFSVGYELSATNLLTMLDTGGIGLIAGERRERDPIVIAGGPAISNPVPFAKFIDAFYFGEAEAGFYDILKEQISAKKLGAGRNDLLDILLSNEFVWSTKKKGRVYRAVWSGFGLQHQSNPACLPVPSIRTVQDHGVVELMRGCPNGCRFCHAGFYYRPFREKDPDIVISEAHYLIDQCGYREITLSSLSTGDYSQLLPVINVLVNKFSQRHISFSLPSLRVDSFTLPVIELLGSVRKSGLTFAIETADPVWQHGLNKKIDIDGIVEILQRAGENGWRSAKMYFMIGLPFSDESESDKIVDFINFVQKKTGLTLHVNVGVFIPKPHTPFERAPQLTEQDALKRINEIRNRLRGKKVKFGYHAPFTSFLEGVLTRGTERTSDIILAAYMQGARLDAWEEHLNRDVWRDVIQNAPWDVEAAVCSNITENAPLPWEMVHSGVNQEVLEREYRRAMLGKLTESCAGNCVNPCGACKSNSGIHTAGKPLLDTDVAGDGLIPLTLRNDTGKELVIMSFEKKREAVFWSHINIMTIIERALQRCGISVAFTKGFNPKPRLDFAQPLPLGIESDDEVFQVVLTEKVDSEKLQKKLNSNLPSGIRILRSKGIEWDGIQKVRKLMSMYDSSLYSMELLGDSQKKARALFDALVTGFAEMPSNSQNGTVKQVQIKDDGTNVPSFLIHCVSIKKALSFMDEVVEGTENIFRLFRIKRIKTLTRVGSQSVDYFSFDLYSSHN